MRERITVVRVRSNKSPVCASTLWLHLLRMPNSASRHVSAGLRPHRAHFVAVITPQRMGCLITLLAELVESM